MGRGVCHIIVLFAIWQCIALVPITPTKYKRESRIELLQTCKQTLLIRPEYLTKLDPKRKPSYEFILFINDNVFVRCRVRGRKNVKSVPINRWRGVVVPGLVSGAPNSWYFCFLSVDNLYLVSLLRAYLVPVRISNQPWLYIRRMICRLDGGWSCCFHIT